MTPAALEQAKAGTVKQSGHESGLATQPREDLVDFASREHDGEPGRALRADDVVHPRQVDT